MLAAVAQRSIGIQNNMLYGGIVTVLSVDDDSVSYDCSAEMIAHMQIESAVQLRSEPALAGGGAFGIMDKLAGIIPVSYTHLVYKRQIQGVISAPGQFGPAATGKVASIMAAGPKASCVQAAQAAINGETTVGTATHFRSASSGVGGIVIGGHVFY